VGENQWNRFEHNFMIGLKMDLEESLMANAQAIFDTAEKEV